jgi:hypothetical protein
LKLLAQRSSRAHSRSILSSNNATNAAIASLNCQSVTLSLSIGSLLFDRDHPFPDRVPADVLREDHDALPRLRDQQVDAAALANRQRILRLGCQRVPPSGSSRSKLATAAHVRDRAAR